MRLIYCRGGDKNAPTIASMCGIEYGVRYDYTAYGKVFMLDGGAEDVNWDRYMQKVYERKPKMALTQDYFNIGCKRRLRQQINDLRKAGVEYIAVCPKFDEAVKDIPDDCMVAISVPTKYAGFLPLKEEVNGRKLHMLGGHPDQCAALSTIYSNAEVMSADMNFIARKASLRQYWSLEGKWVHVEKGSSTTFDLSVKSWENIKIYLSPPYRKFNTNRVARTILPRFPEYISD